MATTKKKKTTGAPKRRRKKTLSSGGKRRKPKQKGFLSDALNPTMMLNNAKSTLAASLGGGAAAGINKALPASFGKFAKVGTGLVLGFLASTFNLNSFANGVAGGMTAIAFAGPSAMNDGDDNAGFASDDSLLDMPLFLSEAGEPMVLEEDSDSGESYYRLLEEDEVTMLEEAGML